MLRRIYQMSGIFRPSSGPIRNLVATSGSQKICRNHSPTRSVKDGSLTEDELLANYNWPKPKDHPLDIIFARDKSPDHPSKTYKEGSMSQTRSLADVDGKRGQARLLAWGGPTTAFSRSYGDVRAGRGRRANKSNGKNSDTYLKRKRSNSSRKGIVSGTEGQTKVKERGRGKLAGTSETARAQNLSNDVSDSKRRDYCAGVQDVQRSGERDVQSLGVTSTAKTFPGQCNLYFQEFLASVKRHCGQMRSGGARPSSPGLESSF